LLQGSQEPQPLAQESLAQRHQMGVARVVQVWVLVLQVVQVWVLVPEAREGLVVLG